MRIPAEVSEGFNTPMKTTDQIRRERLREVIDRDFDGKAGRLADAIKRPRPNISQVLSGSRPFGEALARDIERILELPRGYLDWETDDHADLPPEDQRFINEVATGLHDREIPEHIKQTILTLISSSPEKK